MKAFQFLAHLIAVPFVIVTIHAQGGPATFLTPSVTFINAGLMRDFKIADFNGDGKPDAAGAFQDAVKVYEQSGGAFPTTPSHTLAITSSAALDAGDMNGDGLLDIVNLAFVHPRLEAFLGLSGGGFGPIISTPNLTGIAACPADHCGLAVGDIDQDGLLDAVFSGTNFGVAIGDGTGNFSSWYSIAGTFGPGQVALVDFNGDGNIDIGSCGTNGPLDNKVTICLGNGAGGFSAPTSHTGGDQPYGLAAGDINLDGTPDLVVGDAGGGVDVFTVTAMGGLNLPTNYANTADLFEADFTTVGDLNQDGSPDFATGGQDQAVIGGSIVIEVNAGAGTFANKTVMPLPGTGYPNRVYAKIGYMDGNGIPDLLFGTSGNVSGPPGSSVGYALNSMTALTGWQDLAASLTGATTPHLVGSGSVQAGYPWTLTLSNALPGSTVALFASLATFPLPYHSFRGGVMVPDWNPPNFIKWQAFTASAHGGFPIVATTPLGTPTLTLVFQYWCQDAAGPYGYSASNAVKAN